MFSRWTGRANEKTSNLRRRVLRGDRYRCRGCDRHEREVTVAVHLVHPDAEDEQDMLTLCRRCFAIVGKTKIAASHTPEFLRKLWTVLHAPSSRSELKVNRKHHSSVSGRLAGVSSTAALVGQIWGVYDGSSIVNLFVTWLMGRFGEIRKPSVVRWRISCSILAESSCQCQK